MNKIVFVKYSNERDDKYKIKTVIEQDDSGKRLVKKYAVTEAAKAHIAAIERHEKQLSQNALGTKLHFNCCTLVDDHVACEYVRGEPLSSILEQKITQKDEQTSLQLISDYCAQIQHLATVPFVITEEFQQVFGNPEFLREQKSCVVTNIDLIFSNILVDDNRWNVIDLEWVFDFPIPVNFLLYRAILYGGSRIMEFADRFTILDSLGIDSYEQEQFKNMEHQFQLWVKGTELSLAEMEYFQNRTHIVTINEEIDAMRHQINSITEDLKQSQLAMEAVLQSNSWKITRPLRALLRIIRPTQQQS